MSNKEDIRNIPKDRGWSWAVLVGGFMTFFIISGVIIKSFGIMFDKFQHEFNADATTVSFLSSLVIAIMQFMGAPANLLAARFGTRSVVITGSILTTTGYVASVYVTSIYALFFTYSITIGIGIGCVLAPSLIIVSQYFDKRRSLAIGISTAGSGVASTIVPYVLRVSLEEYGLRGTLLILGGISLNLAIVGSLFRPASFYTRTTTAKLLEANALVPHGVGDNSDTEVTYVQKEATEEVRNASLRDPVLVLSMLTIAIITTAYLTAFVIIPPHLRLLYPGPHSETLVTDVIICMGVADIVTRVFMGWFADLRIMTVTNIITIALFGFTTSVLLLPLAGYSPLALLVTCSCVAATGSTCIALSLSLLTEHFGVVKLSVAYSYTVTTIGVVLLVMPSFLGYLRDVTGQWNVSFYCTGLFSCIAMCCCGSIGPITRRATRDQIQMGEVGILDIDVKL